MQTSPLIEAITSDNTQAFNKQLIPEYLYITDKDGNTPLMLSIKLGRVNFTKELITHYKEIDHENSNGDTAFLQLLLSNQNQSIVNLFLEKKPKVHVINHQGQTALAEAITRQLTTEVLKKIIALAIQQNINFSEEVSKAYNSQTYTQLAKTFELDEDQQIEMNHHQIQVIMNSPDIQGNYIRHKKFKKLPKTEYKVATKTNDKDNPKNHSRCELM